MALAELADQLACVSTKQSLIPFLCHIHIVWNCQDSDLWWTVVVTDTFNKPIHI